MAWNFLSVNIASSPGLPPFASIPLSTRSLNSPTLPESSCLSGGAMFAFATWAEDLTRGWGMRDTELEAGVGGGCIVGSEILRVQ